MRPDAGYLSFKGDRTKSFNMDTACMRADSKVVWPISIEYDPEKDMTRVGYTFQVPERYFPERNEA